MYGTNGKSLGETWNELFIENEGLAKEGKALTDDQLKEKVYESFPNSRGKTTIERVGMIRSDYNAGRGLFKKFGAAGSSEDRPRSNKHTGASGAKKKRRSRKQAKQRAKK